MLDWLAIWGVAQTAKFLFRPVLEDLATDVAKDMAKSYVAKCFKSVFSALHRNPLTKATGLAVKELLVLIEDELRDADLDDEQLGEFIPDVQQFIQHKDVRQTIGALFLEPDAAKLLDPAVFARVWQQLDGVHKPPDGFDWQRIAKRFARKVGEFRNSTSDLRETFESLAKVGDSEALREIAGLPPDFDLETYREALIERFGNLSFESLDTTGAYYSGVRLWSVFVPQSVRECHEYYPQLLELPKEHQERLLKKGELDAEDLAEDEKMLDQRRQTYFAQPLRPVLKVADDPGVQRNVILGDPGSGKSSLLRFLALRWARIEDANLRYTQPLPLLIELRDYNRWECSSGKSFPRYLHEASTWHQLNQQTLDHLLKQPDRVLLLLDGLDEVFDPVQREQVINDIHRFSNEYKQTRIIVTSRVVGYQAHRLREAKFSHFMLQDLNGEQIDAFLVRWHDVTYDDRDEAVLKRERLGRAIRDSKSIAMLAGNPLLLTMMAILNRHQELPRDRVDLYQQATRVLLQQWDAERALEDYPELRGEVDLRAKTAILRSVAYTMQNGPHGLAGNIIVGETLTSLVHDYLRTELHFDQARAAAGAVVRQLRDRNFILCFLGADSYAFVHRTFLEYFCAADFVHRFNIEKSMTIDDLIALFDKHCRDDDWREVLRLICAQIDEQFVGRIVEHLAARTDLDEWDGITPLTELQLAIWCLSEARNKSKLEPTGKRLLNVVIETYRRSAGSAIVPILEAAKELGSHWPCGQMVANVAKSTIQELEYGGELYWPQFVAALYPNRNLILEFVGFESSAIRWDAVEALADHWPDDATRRVIHKCSLSDTDPLVRRAALRELAMKWPDETTHKLLAERALKDENEDARGFALQALVEQWPDETTRSLLVARAFQDENEGPRGAALEALAERWPDQTTRKLLSERAVQDENETVRVVAIAALAAKWPDETTRSLLVNRAIQDEGEAASRTALEQLVERWPDETTRKLLAERAVDPSVSGDQRAAHCASLGKMHSEFGRIVFTRDLDGKPPYVDPGKPISRKHFKQAAKKANVPPGKIDETVRSLSEHMGWDITKGSVG